MTGTAKGDRAIARELRRIKRQHAQLVGEADADRIMERLASLRCKFRELDRVVQDAGGANGDTAPLVAELRQLSRACSSLEEQLKKPRFDERPADALVWMAETRRALIAKAKEREAERARAIEATTVPEPSERPFSVRALLRQQREDRDLDG